MDNINHKENIFNCTAVEETERIGCDNCLDNTVFLMKDSTHSFSMGLSIVLECLEFAIKNGHLPKLPKSWCCKVGDTYDLAFDDDVAYYDYKPLKRGAENDSSGI